jgi:hypothetical protein
MKTFGAVNELSMSPISTISRLKKLENAFHKNEEGISSTKILRSASQHNRVWRRMVVQWCYNVVDHIQADREIVYVAMNILDRFLVSQVTSPCQSQNYLTDRRDYEAAVMASFLITLKLQGISSMCLKDLIKMSRHSVASSDIVRAGEAIVQNLKWSTQLPTAARFVHALIDLLSSSIKKSTCQNLFDECIFSIELSVQDERCCRELPSLVAWIALENAMELKRIPDAVVDAFRCKVSKILELDQNQDLRYHLRGISELTKQDNYNNTSHQGVHIIPPDEEDGFTPSKNTNSFSPRSSLSCNIVSVDDFENTVCRKTETTKRIRKKRHYANTSTLSRSKRTRTF